MIRYDALGVCTRYTNKDHRMLRCSKPLLSEWAILFAPATRRLILSLYNTALEVRSPFSQGECCTESCATSSCDPFPWVPHATVVARSRLGLRRSRRPCTITLRSSPYLPLVILINPVPSESTDPYRVPNAPVHSDNYTHTHTHTRHPVVPEFSVNEFVAHIFGAKTSPARLPSERNPSKAGASEIFGEIFVNMSTKTFIMIFTKIFIIL